MTVLLLNPYATYASGASVDLDNATEAALVAQGRATYVSNPGNFFQPLTPTEAQNVRDMQSSGSVPSVYFKQSGTTTAPILTFDGATSSGVLGTAQPLLLPANSIVPGSSHIRFRVQVGKAGASTGSLDVRIGPNNSTADTNLMSGVAPSWTATTPSEIYIEGVVTFGAGGKAKLVATANVQSVGNNFRYGTEITTLDVTVNNYITFVISGTSAGTSFPFVAYEMALFR